MSPTVVVAIKKAATVILSDKKLLKTVCGIILGVIIIIFMPIFAILALTSGLKGVDLSNISQIVVEHLDDAQIAKLQHVHNTMKSIESSMLSAGYNKIRVQEAQILFNMALYDHSFDSGFVSKLTGCFAPGQTDAQLIAAVNAAFGVNISVKEFTNMMRSTRAVQIDCSDYYDPSTKNNLDLVKWAKFAERNGWGYVTGTFGQVLDESLFEAKLAQYPGNISPYEDFIRENWLGGRTADCIGLIKGYSWFNPSTGTVGYATNGFPDIDPDYMYQSGAPSGKISTLPEIPGLAVWYPGHIGIYIGNGQVIEARGTQVGVVRTQLKYGKWTHWIKIPYINYIEETTEPEDPAPPEPVEP